MSSIDLLRGRAAAIFWLRWRLSSRGGCWFGGADGFHFLRYRETQALALFGSSIARSLPTHESVVNLAWMHNLTLLLVLLKHRELTNGR